LRLVARLNYVSCDYIKIDFFFPTTSFHVNKL
jgi:hypothetical protein